MTEFAVGGRSRLDLEAFASRLVDRAACKDLLAELPEYLKTNEILIGLVDGFTRYGDQWVLLAATNKRLLRIGGGNFDWKTYGRISAVSWAVEPEGRVLVLHGQGSDWQYRPAGVVAGDAFATVLRDQLDQVSARKHGPSRAAAEAAAVVALADVLTKR